MLCGTTAAYYITSLKERERLRSLISGDFFDDYPA